MSDSTRTVQLCLIVLGWSSCCLCSLIVLGRSSCCLCCLIVLGRSSCCLCSLIVLGGSSCCLCCLIVLYIIALRNILLSPLELLMCKWIILWTGDRQMITRTIKHPTYDFITHKRHSILYNHGKMYNYLMVYLLPTIDQRNCWFSL